MVLPSSSAADPVVEGVLTFADVPESSMFHKEISWLGAEGISTGWDIGGGLRLYRPLDSIARNAMAAFLYRKAGSPAYTPPASSPFTDVAPGAAFYKEITWLASQGISIGWDVGGGKREYRPLNPIARDAMAAFLFRFAKPGEFTGPAQSPFVDVAAGGAFYREITWLASSGISTGWDIGGGVREYRPLNGIARDAMAAFLYRYAAEKVSTNPLDPAAGTVTLAPEVQLLEPPALDSARVSGGTVVLPSQDARDIHPNDVLVAGITPTAPDGLLVRVIQVSRDPAGSTTLTTEPATLPETVVATSGLLEVSGIPESSTFVPEADVTTTSAAASKGAPEALSGQANIFSQSLTWEKTQKAVLGSSTLSGSGSVSVTSTVTAAAKARMTLDTSFLQLKETSVIVTPSLTATHSQTFSGSLKGTISAPLGTLWAKFRFMIGPVPVIVRADVKVRANLSVEGEAEVSYTSSNTVSSDHGLKYKDGTFSLINTKPVGTATDKTVQATKSLTARASLDFDATIKFYGVAGITFGAGPYASVAIAVVTSNGAKTWSCPMEFGHETRVGVVAGIEILGLKAEWSDVTTTSWKLAESNPCEGTPVVAPGPGTPPPPNPTPTPTPTSPGGLDGVASLSGEWDTRYAVKTDGTVWAWGRNNLGGGLGNGSTTDSSTPVRVTGLTDVREVVASAGRVWAVKADGSVWAWGYNFDSRFPTAGLGLNTTVPYYTVPVEVPALKGIRTVEASGTFGTFYALKNDGTVLAWGDNSSGRLGTGSYESMTQIPSPVAGLTDVQRVETGDTLSAYAVRSDGTLWAWGKNNAGQLGNGTRTDSAVPVQTQGIGGVKDIVPSSYSAYVLKSDGSVWAWGDGDHGQLGNGNTTFSAVPLKVDGISNAISVAASDYSAFAVKADGTVWGWGSNSFNVLADGVTRLYSTKPVMNTAVSNIRSITGFGSIYATDTSGRLWAWGDNRDRRLGNGVLTDVSAPAQVAGIVGVQRVLAGGPTTLALLADGTAWAWGDNSYGQLGNGSTAYSSVPVRIGQS